jgi:hypothetical protein
VEEIPLPIHEEATIKKKIANVREDVEKLGPSVIASGIMAVLQNIKHKINYYMIQQISLLKK